MADSTKQPNSQIPPSQQEKEKQLTCSGCKSYCPLTNTGCQIGERQALALHIITPDQAVHAKAAALAANKSDEKSPEAEAFWQQDFVDANQKAENPSKIITEVIVKPKTYW